MILYRFRADYSLLAAARNRAIQEDADGDVDMEDAPEEDEEDDGGRRSRTNVRASKTAARTSHKDSWCIATVVKRCVNSFLYTRAPEHLYVSSWKSIYCSGRKPEPKFAAKMS